MLFRPDKILYKFSAKFKSNFQQWERKGGTMLSVLSEKGEGWKVNIAFYLSSSDCSGEDSREAEKPVVTFQIHAAFF